MKLTIARAASALAVAALAVTAAAGPAAAASVGEFTVEYQGIGQGYLLELLAPTSVWSSGGPVAGTVTIAQPCEEPDGSTEAELVGTFRVTGTFNPHGVDAGGDQFILTAASQNVIGGLTMPVTGMIVQGGVVFGATEDWTVVSQTSQFYGMVEGMGPVLASCP
jgi:hypothetical protein